MNESCIQQVFGDKRVITRSKYRRQQHSEIVNEGTESNAEAENVSQTTPTILLQYSILKIVFSYLNIRDLLVCSKVCKVWNEVGTIVRKHRINKPELLLYHLYPVERTREVVELSNNFQVSDSTISWATDRSTCPRESELKREVRANMLCTELEPRLWNAVDNQFSEPSQIVCVGTQSLANYLQLRRNSSATRSRKSRIDLFKRLGNLTPCIGVLGYGLVLTLPDNSSCLENECRSRGRFLPMVTGLVIPKVAGFKVSMFSLKRNHPRTSRIKKATSENCEELLNIQPGDKVKGIVLFQSHQVQLGEEEILLSAVHEFLKKNPNVAFGGGLFTETFTRENDEKLIGCGLVFSGDDSVTVGSVALQDARMTDQNLQNLRKFKSLGRGGPHDFAFMFCCNGRGFGMHDAEHVESTLFRSEYPQTPLIGAFTGGEYFHPYIPGQLDTANVVNRRRELHFGYTTVFIYVSPRRVL